MAVTVLLRGLPDLPALQDQLTVYFARRGQVRGVRLLGPGRAIVTFAEDSVAQAVLCEQENLFFGTKIKIESCPRDLVIDDGDGKHQQTVIEKGTDFAAHDTSAVKEMVSGEVDVGAGMANYLQTHRADGIMEVERSLSLESVRIRNMKTGFSLRGTTRGVSRAKEGLKEMAASVKTAVLTVHDTDQLRGFHQFITKEKTTRRLHDVERNQQCVIVLDDKCSLDSMENEDVAFPAPPSSCDEDNCELRIGGLILQVVLGDLTKETAAAIVVPISNVLDHKRGIARTVHTAAGPSVLEQCREYVRTEGRPRGGDIIVVEGGRLPCGAILYLTSPDARHLRSDVKNCLCLANNHGGCSIALPAIGTGGFRVAPEKCAQRMINGIMEFAQHPRGNRLTLKLVRIVVHQDRIMEAFRTEIFKRSNAYGATHDRLTDGHSNELLLHFFGPDETGVEEAKRGVQEMVDNYSTHEIIVDPAVLELSAEERSMLQVYGRREKVMITIDEENDGCYHIEGSCDVSVATSVVRRFLADRSENRTARREILGLRRFQWYYVLPSGECRPFSADNNDRTEEIHQADQQTAYCIIGGELCVVDIHDRTLTVLSSGAIYDILREDLACDRVGAVPETWDPQPHDRNTNRPKVCHMVKLNPGSPEYVLVQNKFLASGGRVRIISIERVQSPALWEQYSVIKRNLLSRNSTTLIEKELWHGTNAEACREISPNGFNRRYSGQHGTAYGKGTYFALNVSYSAHDRYSSPDAQGRKKIYLAKVLTGEFTRGSRNMVVPPRRQDSSGLAYDSTVDDTKRPTTYVVFHDAQAYPQYLITFKMVPK
ncbi:PARP14 [Branchiostoma lanceolatum]|uniref:PARP14 protein n=2 Tax=Branchiostoma lanceolatum TaxID=7740 RepID=A0A8K0EKP6_BRALA|nr:PARP14 [Branchiostoma lanceolatum]